MNGCREWVRMTLVLCYKHIFETLLTNLYFYLALFKGTFKKTTMSFENNKVADPHGIVVKEEIGTAEEAGRKLFIFQFIIFIAILGL